MIDLAAIRAGLADAAGDAAFAAYSFPPDDLNELPAAFVGPPREIEALTLTKWKITVPVTLFVSSVDAEDAARTLDRALSYKMPVDEEEEDPPPISFLDALDALSSPPWSTVRFLSSEVSRYTLPSGGVAWGALVSIEVVAS